MDEETMTYHEAILQGTKDLPHRVTVVAHSNKKTHIINAQNLDEAIKAANFVALNVNGEWDNVGTVIITHNKCFVAQLTRKYNQVSGKFHVKRHYSSKEMQVYFSSI